MKWWYVVFVIVGCGLGWWVLGNYSANKGKSNVISVKSGAIIEETKNLPVKYMNDISGKKQSSVEIAGVVEGWDPEIGSLQISKGGKSWLFVVNPEKTLVYVNSLKDKFRDLVVNRNSGLNWGGAFCKGDSVVVYLAGTDVVMISNSGYRVCGYKEE